MHSIIMTLKSITFGVYNTELIHTQRLKSEISFQKNILLPFANAYYGKIALKRILHIISDI